MPPKKRTKSDGSSLREQKRGDFDRMSEEEKFASYWGSWVAEVERLLRGQAWRVKPCDRYAGALDSDNSLITEGVWRFSSLRETGGGDLVAILVYKGRGSGGATFGDKKEQTRELNIDKDGAVVSKMFERFL